MYEELRLNKLHTERWAYDLEKASRIVAIKWYLVSHLLELSGLVLVSEMLNMRLEGVGCTRASRGS